MEMEQSKSKLVIAVIASMLFIVSACKSEGPSKEEPSSITPTLTREELKACKKRVIENGDVDAFDSLKLHYWYPDILPWALVMANKYESMNAASQVYNALEELSPTRTLEGLDDETREMALKYLKLSVERGHYYDAKRLAEYYEEGKYVPKDETEAARLMNIYEEGKLNYEKRKAETD